MLRPPDVLELPAHPDAVGQARRWLRAQLTGWSEVGLEAAQLVASELVTNVVLHGRGPMQVALERRDREALLEVLDRSPVAPVVTHYGHGATTGRGLLLVDGISRGWGVRRFPNGKGVWALIGDELIADQPPAAPGASGSERGHAPPSWDPPEDLTTAPEPRTGASEHDQRGVVTVRIIDLPLPIYLAAQQHNDALMREFRWLIERGEQASVPARLVQLAGDAHTRFGRQTAAIRAQVNAAVVARHERLNIEVEIPRSAWQIVTQLAELLDEADAYCETGDLLTLASPPDLRRFRTWYLDQVLGQLAGREPSPWPAEWELTASDPIGKERGT